MKNLLKKESVNKIKKFLIENNLDIPIITLEDSAKSAVQAAESLKVETGSIIKSIIFKSIKSKFYLCLVSGDKTVSINKLSKLTKDEILKPNAIEVKKYTGYSIGGIPPFAHKTKMPTYIDISLSRYDEIYAAAGHPHCILKIDYLKICKITNGFICDIIN